MIPKGVPGELDKIPDEIYLIDFSASNLVFFLTGY